MTDKAIEPTNEPAIDRRAAGRQPTRGTVGGRPKHFLVIVGCGGVAWHSLSWLLSEFREDLSADRLLAFDPDTLEERNLRRQWCWLQNTLGDSKVDLLVEELTDSLSFGSYECLFTAERGKQALMEAGGVPEDASLVVFAWPDNNKGRAEAFQFAEYHADKADRVFYITAGNGRDGAQAMGSLWVEGKIVADLRTRHADILADTEENNPTAEQQAAEEADNRCDAQTILANAMASTLSLHMYHHLLREVAELEEQPLTLYWRRNRKGKPAVWGEPCVKRESKLALQP